MRDAGVAPQSIGLVYLLMLPWVLKVLWAPRIEAIRLSRPAAVRRIVAVGSGLMLAALLLMLLSDPGAGFSWIFLLLTLAAFASATVDIAADGHAIDQLKPDNRGWGNVMQVGGGYLGTLVGAGLVLIAIEQFSWSQGMGLMIGCLLLLLLPVLWLQEGQSRSGGGAKPSLKAALNRAEIRWGLLTVLVAQFGLRLVQGMTMPFLIDKGFSLTSLGMMGAFAGVIASLLGVALAGVLVKRFGAWRVLMGLLLAQLLVYIAFYLASAQVQVDWWLATGLLLLSSGAAAASFVALYTAMMGWSASDQAGVDFSLMQSTDAAVALIAGVLSGVLVAQLGYSQYFLCAVCATLLALIILPLIQRQQRTKAAQEVVV